MLNQPFLTGKSLSKLIQNNSFSLNADFTLYFKMQIYKKKMKNPTHFTTDWI